MAPSRSDGGHVRAANASSTEADGREMSSNPSPVVSVWLVVRSLLWTILLPGFFAGYVPWRYFGLNRVRLDVMNAGHVLGLLCIVVGATLLGACIFEFARSGRGTLSPVDPPRHLVIRGLYRYVRNPMYLSVTIIVLGEVLVTRSSALVVYLIQDCPSTTRRTAMTGDS